MCTCWNGLSEAPLYLNSVSIDDVLEWPPFSYCWKRHWSNERHEVDVNLFVYMT